MTPVSKAPDNLNALRTEIADRFESLSPRLKQVAIYALDNPNDMALETLAVIAGHCETQPSTIVRFAKQFGYRGASEMQRVFRDQLFNMEPTPSYQERIRRFNEQLESPEEISALKLLQEFSASNIIALEHLSQEASNGKLTRAIKMIEKAETVYVVGMRRSFPVASYMFYTLSHVGKKTYLLDGVAGMSVEQSSMASRRDLLIAISFQPYAQETANAVDNAVSNKAKIIGITDSHFSLVGKQANISFEVKDAEVRQFRSLDASLCLAQTLALGYGILIRDHKTKPGQKGRSLLRT